MTVALEEAAWTVKCCFCGTKIADAVCAIFYLLVGSSFGLGVFSHRFCKG